MRHMNAIGNAFSAACSAINENLTGSGSRRRLPLRCESLSHDGRAPSSVEARLRLHAWDFGNVFGYAASGSIVTFTPRASSCLTSRSVRCSMENRRAAQSGPRSPSPSTSRTSPGPATSGPYEARPMRTVHVVLPNDIDDPATPSGGNTYDRRICQGLAAWGWSVREHAVPGPWPRPTVTERAGLARVLFAVPDNAVVLLDGLVASAVPDP